MTNFCYSDIASRLKLHLLKTYPPGAMVPMSDFSHKTAVKEETKVAPLPVKVSKTLQLHAPPEPVSFENKAIKNKLEELFPEMGLKGFALVAKRSEVADSQNLLTAIRTKLALCDLLIVEEMVPLQAGQYRALFGTESTLASLPAGIKKVPYPEWSVLSTNIEAKKALWNTLSEVCRSTS